MNESDRPQTQGEHIEHIQHDSVGGIFNSREYEGTTINLDKYEITRLLDDLLLVQYVDVTDDSLMRDGIHIPISMLEQSQVWRVGKVLKVGPKTTINVGEYVVIPNDKGIKLAKANGLKDLVFLNEARVFAVAAPTAIS